MENIFQKLSEDDFKVKSGQDGVFNGIYKVLKIGGNSGRMIEICSDLKSLLADVDFAEKYCNILEYRKEADVQKKKLQDQTISEQDKKNAREYYFKIKKKLEIESREFSNIIGSKTETPYPLVFLSQKIGKGISVEKLRGPALSEDLSLALQFIFNKNDKEIKAIKWIKDELSPEISEMPPLRVLFYDAENNEESLVDFFTPKSSIIEGIGNEKQILNNLQDLFTSLSYFRIIPESPSRLLLEMDVEVVNNLFRRNLNRLPNISQVFDETANMLLRFFASDLILDVDEGKMRKQHSIILSFIIKHLILLNDRVRLDVNGVDVFGKEECESIAKISHYLFLNKVYGEHGSIRVTINDVIDTLKFYFMNRRGKYSDLGNIRIVTEEGRFISKIEGVIKPNSLIGEIQNCVEYAIGETKIFRDFFLYGKLPGKLPGNLNTAKGP